MRPKDPKNRNASEQTGFALRTFEAKGKECSTSFSFIAAHTWKLDRLGTCPAPLWSRHFTPWMVTNPGQTPIIMPSRRYLQRLILQGIWLRSPVTVQHQQSHRKERLQHRETGDVYLFPMPRLMLRAEDGGAHEDLLVLSLCTIDGQFRSQREP